MNKVEHFFQRDIETHLKSKIIFIRRVTVPHKTPTDYYWVSKTGNTRIGESSGVLLSLGSIIHGEEVTALNYRLIDGWRRIWKLPQTYSFHTRQFLGSTLNCYCWIDWDGAVGRVYGFDKFLYSSNSKCTRGDGVKHGKYLGGNTTGEETFGNVTNVLGKYSVLWPNCLRICSDGAAAINGILKEFTVAVVEVAGHLIFRHCMV